MKLDKYCFDGSKKLELSNMPTDAKGSRIKKDAAIEKTEANLKRLGELQEMLYAEGKESVVFVFQAMDAAGKDSTIKNVMGAFNPQGVDVVTFKQPSIEELAHDFLWRAVKAMPERGKIGIFNRSHYEDVLVVKVRELYKYYTMPKRCIGEDIIDRRYKQIANFEEYMFENGYRIVKFFLNVSKDEQKKRFLERIELPHKNWKFNAGDIDDRVLWHDYMGAYEEAINHTATKYSPWFVLPADQKWYTRYLVSEAALSVLEDCNPSYPPISEGERVAMKTSREKLMAE